MTFAANPARDRLAKGEVAIGIGVRQARTIEIATAMRTAGYDWLFIDLEHGSQTLDTAAQLSVACLAAGITPLVRIPRGQYDMATRALDGGAWGIVMPHVDSAEEAREIVDRVKYPPAGHRSMMGGLPQLGYGAMAMGEAAPGINSRMLVVVMIESPQAVASAEKIAAVPGVDALLVGGSDLTMEMGLPGQFFHADVVKAMDTVIAGCRKHGKWPGLGGIYSEDGIRRYVGAGMRLVLAGSDFSFMMAGASAAAKMVRGLG